MPPSGQPQMSGQKQKACILKLSLKTRYSEIIKNVNQHKGNQDESNENKIYNTSPLPETYVIISTWIGCIIKIKDILCESMKLQKNKFVIKNIMPGLFSIEKRER